MSPRIPRLPAPGAMEGRGLLVADLVGTVVFGVVTAVNVVVHDDAIQVASLAVSAVLFTGGCIAFAIGFLRAVGRSRDEEIHLAGLFYLTGTAPDEVRTPFMWLWFAQMAIAVGAVAVSRPPFGVLSPVWGIGLITWWASRYATFGPRVQVSRPRRPGSPPE